MMDKNIWKTILGILFTLAVPYQASGFGQDMNQCASRKMDLVVIMDGTISMGYEPFEIQRYFVYEILSKMSFGPQATQLAVIQFSDQWSTKIEMEMGLHGGREDVLRNVSNIEFQQGGRTKAGFAMYLAYEQFFGFKSKARPAVDKVILLISDGKPTDMDLLHKVVMDLKEKQVRIVTVAIGSSYNYIQRFRYTLRSIASGFKRAFKSEKDRLNKQSIIEDVAREICETIKVPQTPKGKPKLQQKCFQEKKDILFALDGSMNLNTETFNRAKSIVAEICSELDITPSLIHVGMLQYSDALNTRIEFGLSQYTNYYQVNQSLENVFHSKGRGSDLSSALTIIDEQVFNGENGDRISADDYLLLFVDDIIPQSDEVLAKLQRLKDKGVHVIIIGFGKSDEVIGELYEKMASHPSDVNYMGSVLLKHIVGDLTAITCRKVDCEHLEKKEKNTKDKRASEEESLCQQRSQDVLFMIDTTRDMNPYFKKALKFFTKFVKRLSIAATKTHVGLMTFGRSKRRIELELGEKKFEADINRKILNTWQSDKWARQPNVAAALREVNKKIFNTSTGGHRKKAPDLIFIATRGNLMNRFGIQNQVAVLRQKGVRIAVLDVGYKTPVVNYRNAMRDMASGAKDIYPMDFRRVLPISQGLIELKCKVERKTVSPQCFLRQRKVFFMLDSSKGLANNELPAILQFIEDIVRRLYTNPHNIQIGLMYYSDLRTARFALVFKKRSLRHALIGIRKLRWRYRQGRKNYLGYALRMVRQLFLARPISVNEDQIIVILAHNEPADPEKAFKSSEMLRSHGVEIITVAIYTKKSPMKLNPQYKALASSSSNAHSFDFDKLVNSSIDIVLNMCEFNTCPKDTTKHCTPKKQDIFMVIDSSRSIGYTIFPRLRRFVRRLVGKLDISEERTHVGILQASDHERTQYEMKLGEFTNPKEIESVISEMSYHKGYGTYIGKGLEMAIRDNLFNASSNFIPNGLTRNVDRGDAENILMVYSDGVFHDERQTIKTIDSLKRLGVRVVVVGLGSESRRPEAKSLLERMATTRSDVYLISLRKPSLLVEQELNEVAQHVTTLQCVNLYPPPVECTPESLDLFVVLDGSRSVGYVNFGKVQAFLKKLSEEFLIGKDNAHFGVLQFGTVEGTRIEFNLDEYYSNRAVKEAIEKIQFLESRETQTGHALSVVSKEIFNGKGGDRPNVPNILILFTDGSAHRFSLAKRQATELKSKGTRIIGIGAGEQIDKKVFGQIQQIVSSKKDAHKSKFDELSGIVDDLLDVVCI